MSSASLSFRYQRALALRSSNQARARKVATVVYSWALENDTATHAQIDAYVRAGNMLAAAGARGAEMSEALFLDACEIVLDTRHYRRAWASFGVDWTAIPQAMVELLGGTLGVFTPEEVRGWTNEHYTPTFEYMAELHIRLMHIHPLPDGNGRMGRLLWEWAAARAGLRAPMLRTCDRAEYKRAVARKDVEKLAALLARRA